MGIRKRTFHTRISVFQAYSKSVEDKPTLSPPPTHIFYNIEILNDKLVKLPLPAPQIKIMKISEVSGSFFSVNIFKMFG